MRFHPTFSSFPRKATVSAVAFLFQFVSSLTFSTGHYLRLKNEFSELRTLLHELLGLCGVLKWQHSINHSL